jgi:hypothetical protein
MAIPFTSVANEVVTSATTPEGFDCLALASWTDVTRARVRLSETESDRGWSSLQVPVRAIMGSSVQVQPLLHLPQPVFLEARATIKGDWINTGTEPASTACFHAIKVGLDPSRHPYDGQVEIRRSYGFWLLVDLGALIGTTDPVNNDVLIWGATTNAEPNILGRITNSSSNYSWSDANIPLRAMAGVDGQVQPIMRYHRPYLLPNNVKLRVDVSAAVTGNYIAFLCERILQ